MRTPVSDARTTDTIRYHLTRPQQAVFYFAPLVILTESFITMGSSRLGWYVPLFVFVVVLYLPLGVLNNAFGVTLTPYEAIVHRFRARHIAWEDVESIEIERRSGSRVIAIYEVDGRRTQLRAPVSGFLNWDRRFEEKFHTIGRWWLDHRAADAVGPVAADAGVGAAAARAGWGGRNSVTGWARRTRIRPSAVQTSLISMILAGLLFEGMFAAFGQPEHASGAHQVVGGVVGGLVVLAALAGLWHFALHAGVSFTDEALRVHNPHPSTIRWSEITSIEVERSWHGVRLVVREGSGRATRLSGPRIGIVLWDADFEAKARAVHSRWQAALGRQDSSTWDMGAVRGPGVWRMLLVGLVSVALGAELLVGALIAVVLAVSF